MTEGTPAKSATAVQAKHAPAHAHEAPYLPPGEAVEFDREIQYHQLIVLGVAMLAITLLSGVLVFFMLRGFVHWRSVNTAPPPVMAAPATEMKGAKLLARPEAELARVREQETQQLTSYGWVDPAAGVAHMPIERALDLIAKRGLPARSAAASDAAAAGAAGPATPPAAAPTTAAAPTASPAASQGVAPPATGHTPGAAQ